MGEKTLRHRPSPLDDCCVCLWIMSRQREREPFGFDVCAISLILATILYSFDDEHRQRVSATQERQKIQEWHVKIRNKRVDLSSSHIKGNRFKSHPFFYEGEKSNLVSFFFFFLFFSSKTE